MCVTQFRCYGKKEVGTGENFKNVITKQLQNESKRQQPLKDVWCHIIKHKQPNINPGLATR